MANEYGIWWTAPAEGESGKTILVTGRKDVEKFRNNPRYNIRVEIAWPYEGGEDGLPDKETSELMENVQEALQLTFKKDPVAVLTGIFTGENQRDWIFYTLSTHIFNRKLNETLDPFPFLPIKIYAENDPDWEAYDEMSAAEIKLD